MPQLFTQSAETSTEFLSIPNIVLQKPTTSLSIDAYCSLPSTLQAEVSRSRFRTHLTLPTPANQLRHSLSPIQTIIYKPILSFVTKIRQTLIYAMPIDFKRRGHSFVHLFISHTSRATFTISDPTLDGSQTQLHVRQIAAYCSTDHWVQANQNNPPAKIPLGYLHFAQTFNEHPTDAARFSTFDLATLQYDYRGDGIKAPRIIYSNLFKEQTADTLILGVARSNEFPLGLDSTCINNPKEKKKQIIEVYNNPDFELNEDDKLFEEIDTSRKAAAATSSNAPTFI